MIDIVFIGIQGAGKTTLSNKLSSFGYKAINPSILIQQLLLHDKELSQEITLLVQQGQLIPNNILIHSAMEYVNNRRKFKGLIWDGFPRTPSQVLWYISLMKAINRTFLCVELNVNRSIAIERIRSRAELLGREEDQHDEIVTQRHNLYFKTIKSSKKIWKKHSNLISIDASNDINTVYKNVCNKIILTKSKDGFP